MLKVERIFSDNDNLKFSDIVNSLIVEYIEKHLMEYYNSNKVNLTTMYKIDVKGDVA